MPVESSRHPPYVRHDQPLPANGLPLYVGPPAGAAPPWLAAPMPPPQLTEQLRQLPRLHEWSPELLLPRQPLHSPMPPAPGFARLPQGSPHGFVAAPCRAPGAGLGAPASLAEYVLALKKPAQPHTEGWFCGVMRASADVRHAAACTESGCNSRGPHLQLLAREYAAMTGQQRMNQMIFDYILIASTPQICLRIKQARHAVFDAFCLHMGRTINFSSTSKDFSDLLEIMHDHPLHQAHFDENWSLCASDLERIVRSQALRIFEQAPSRLREIISEMMPRLHDKIFGDRHKKMIFHDHLGKAPCYDAVAFNGLAPFLGTLPTGFDHLAGATDIVAIATDDDVTLTRFADLARAAPGLYPVAHHPITAKPLCINEVFRVGAWLVHQDTP